MNTDRSNLTTVPLRLIAADLPFVLAQGRLLHLGLAGEAGAPWRLQVQAGAVWVTWPGCGDDVFLAVGEQVEVPAGVTALVEVEPRLWRGAARLCLQQPGGASGRGRLSRWLSAWRPAGTPAAAGG